MSKRIIYLFLLFLISANNLFADDDIVPPIIIKQPKKWIATSSGPTKTISKTHIVASGHNNLSQLLQHVGGLQLHDTTGNGSQVLIGMRGFGANASSNSLLLINGLPIVNPDIAPPDLNIIPVYDIAAIEIKSGSESVLYGDQAVGGIINIKTHAPLKDNLDLACGFGSYQQKNCELWFTKKWNQQSLQTRLYATHTDNYRQHNQYDEQLLSGLWQIKHALNLFNLDYHIANENMQYPGALTAKEAHENRRQANNKKNFFKDWNGFLLAHDEYILSPTWDLRFDLARRDMHGQGILFTPFNQLREIYFFKSQLNGVWHNATLNNGIEIGSDDYHLKSFLGLTDNQQQKISAYTLWNIPITSNLLGSFGARFATQENALKTDTTTDSNNQAFVTTAGFTYKLSTSTQFYLRRAGSFRFPKADELASTNTGIASLKTQTGFAYETGVNYENTEIVLNINLYQLMLHDEIAFDPLQTPLQPFGSNQNLPPTKRVGFSLNGQKKLSDAFTLDGQYDFVDARFQHGLYAGNRIPLVSASIYHAGLQYQYQEHWQFYVESIFTGNQFAANDNANVSSILGGYTIFNASIRYVWKQFSASLHVNNIFNKLFYFYSVYEPDSQLQFFYPAPERNFTLLLTYHFL